MIKTPAFALALTGLLAFITPAADAGRTSGPASEVVVVPGYQSVYYDIPFDGGQVAVVTIRGNGASVLNLSMHDFDGHVAVGAGSWDAKVVSMYVYRPGTLRIQIDNIGQNADAVVIQTN
jgi:hypothetical protein